MLTLRIYNGDVMLRELAGVMTADAQPSGALTCELSGGPAPCVRSVVFAPGAWTEVEHWHVADEPAPVEQAERERLGLLDHEDPAITNFPAAMTDGARVHEAMAIACACAELRCPLVLNPASTSDKRWWRIRQYGGSDTAGAGAPNPEPLQQCSHERGHDPAVIPHEWTPGGWPYGPSQHHRACPRHPDSYNRAALGEGQPQHAAGVTPTDVVPAAAPPAPTGEMIRPYVAERHAQPAAAAEADTAVMPAIPSGINATARTSWHVCAAFSPEHGSAVFCEWPIGHASDIGHRHSTSGGEIIRWE